MASTEDIEAKLCAYIEGVLDPADKAEIEKHLEANPHHRALLGDLVKTRQFVQALPRESAPDEILEAVQGQLERSALLQEVDGDAVSTSMRINRLPQLLATAAVLLLTIGLGVVIYYVLPRSNRSNDYAYVPIPATTAPAPLLSPDAIEPSTSSDFGVAMKPSDVPPRAELVPGAGAEIVERDIFAATPALPSAQPEATSRFKEYFEENSGVSGELAKTAPASKGGVFDMTVARKPGTDESIASIDFEAAKDQLSNADVARRLKDTSGGLKDNSLFVVVTTDDAKATKSQVAGYLTSNQIRWDEVSQSPPEPLALDASQRVLASRQAPAQDYRLKGDTSGAATDAASAPAEESRSRRSTAADAKESETAAKTSEPPDEVKQHTDKVKQDPNAAKQPAAQSPEPAGQAVTESDVAAARQRLTQTQPAASGPVSELSGELIVARSMTRSQATELQASLSSQVNVYRARLYDPPVISESGQAMKYEFSGDGASIYSNLAAVLGRDVEVPLQPGFAREARVTTAATAPIRSQQVASETSAAALVTRNEDLATSQPSTDAILPPPERVDVVIVVKDQPIDRAENLQQLEQQMPAVTAVPATSPVSEPADSTLEDAAP